MPTALPKTKKCSKCGEMLGVEEFYRQKDRRCKLGSRLRSCCKKCALGADKNYRDLNLEKERKRARNYYETHQGGRREAHRKYYAEGGGRERQKKYYKENLEKIRERAKKYYDKNSEKVRERELKKKYGLSPQQWNDIFESQGKCCAICNNINTDKKGWAVDHNHKTGLVRGILCGTCNRGLGHFKDSPPTLRSAAEYLEKWGET